MSTDLNNSLILPPRADAMQGRAEPQISENCTGHSCAFGSSAGRTVSGGLFDGRGRRKYLSAEERERFLTAAATFNPEIETLSLLLHFTGCRISEALALRRCHVDFVEGAVIFETLKQRRRGVLRMLPLPNVVVERLTDRDAPEDARLFSWHRSTAWEKISLVMRRAKIVGPQACPRGVRHGFGVAAISAGVPLTLVQRWLGHARLETTSIYLAVIGPEERHFAQGLWRRSELASNRKDPNHESCL